MISLKKDINDTAWDYVWFKIGFRLWDHIWNNIRYKVYDKVTSIIMRELE